MVATALTIAGSDSGGGAGVQADLKAMSARGVYGASVLTAITAQNTCAVTAVHEIPTEIVAAQIAAVLSDIRIDAIKIGMLGSPALIETVAQGLASYAGPVVLDPVMVSKSGARLLPEAAIGALKAVLVPRAELLTPNLPEAQALLGSAASGDPQTDGARLLEMGAQAVLMKGGHADGPTCTDWLVTRAGTTAFTAPRRMTRNTHGTGCSYGAAIAAELAKGAELAVAVARAHAWLQGAIAAADQLEIGKGHGPLHHFHALWS